MSDQTTAFKPTLGLFDSTMIVAGSMIGSGIFIVSADITRNVGSAGWLIAVWVITGFMTLTAALSYAGPRHTKRFRPQLPLGRTAGSRTGGPPR